LGAGVGDGGGSANVSRRAAYPQGQLPDGSIIVSDRIFQRIRKIAPDMHAET
jgi:hypothetical protein